MSVLDDVDSGKIPRHDSEKVILSHFDFAELLRLAKLGEAAEKIIDDSGKRFLDSMCKIMPVEISDRYCKGCPWTEFCRLRAEGAGNNALDKNK